MITENFDNNINNLLFISTKKLKTKDSMLLRDIHKKIFSPWVVDKDIYLIEKYNKLYYKRKILINCIKRDNERNKNLRNETFNKIEDYKSDLISLANDVKYNNLKNKEKILKIMKITPEKIQKAFDTDFSKSVILSRFAKKVMESLELPLNPQNNSLRNN